MKRILKSAAVLALASVMALSASATLIVLEESDAKLSLPSYPKTEVVTPTAEEVALLTDAQAYLAESRKLSPVAAELVGAEGIELVAEEAVVPEVDLSAVGAEAAELLAGAAEMTAEELAALAAAAVEAEVVADAAADAAIDLGTMEFEIVKGTAATISAKLAEKVNNLTIIVGEVEGNFSVSAAGATKVNVIKDRNNGVTLINIKYGRATDEVVLTVNADSDKVTVSDIVVAAVLGDAAPIVYKGAVSGGFAMGAVKMGSEWVGYETYFGIEG